MLHRSYEELPQGYQSFLLRFPIKDSPVSRDTFSLMCLEDGMPGDMYIERRGDYLSLNWWPYFEEMKKHLPTDAVLEHCLELFCMQTGARIEDVLQEAEDQLARHYSELPLVQKIYDGMRSLLKKCIAIKKEEIPWDERFLALEKLLFERREQRRRLHDRYHEIRNSDSFESQTEVIYLRSITVPIVRIQKEASHDREYPLLLQIGEHTSVECIGSSPEETGKIRLIVRRKDEMPGMKESILYLHDHLPCTDVKVVIGERENSSGPLVKIEYKTSFSVEKIEGTEYLVIDDNGSGLLHTPLLALKGCLYKNVR